MVERGQEFPGTNKRLQARGWVYMWGSVLIDQYQWKYGTVYYKGPCRIEINSR